MGRVGRESSFQKMSFAAQVPFNTEDRQWDGRFNVPNDGDLDALIEGIKADNDRGKFQYILIGGVEVGTRPQHSDYEIRHVHVAAMFTNRTSKRAILTNWKVKQGLGYYLVPRNRDLPYSGWRDHHIKAFSKVDPGKLILFESGDLPKDLKRKRVEASEKEKKMPMNEILKEMRVMLNEDKDEECIEKYPKHYYQWGEKIKSTLKQRRTMACNDGNPHLWLQGWAGTGKTAVLNFIYPKLYKKNLTSRFFDLYDPKENTHMMLEDMDYEGVKKLGINFLKTICDEAGFPIDQKYKTPSLARTTVLVTSNFELKQLVPEGPGYAQNYAAIRRRFWEMKIAEFLKLLNLQIVPWEQLKELKKAGNEDTSKCFLDWDYCQNVPTGKELKEPEEYQQMVRDYFYALTQ
nr:nonstructural protein [Flumine parvovirus 14]